MMERHVGRIKKNGNKDNHKIIKEDEEKNAKVKKKL